MREALLFRGRSVGIWGTGYIGYTTMLHLAAKGVTCVGYDPDSRRVADINRGQHPVLGLNDWLDIDPQPLVSQRLIRATESVEEILNPNVVVHVVAVPTERDGCPWWEPLRDVTTRLATAISARAESAGPPSLVVIESTLAPGTIDSMILPILATHRLTIGRDLLLGIAPRRDWFISPDKNLRTLDRVYFGVDEPSADSTQEFLSLVCENLHRASNYRTGELVKCVENAFRQVEIALANQLSLGYPNVDIGEVLALANTKWNMGYFQPSFGMGGYCIPLAGQYLLQGAIQPEALSLLSAALASDMEMRRRVADAILRRGRRRVGILGLSYRRDLKVAAMSPAVLIAKHLRDAGASVKIHDPYYAQAEVVQEAGVPSFDLSDLEQFDTLLVHTDHQRYVEPDVRDAVLAWASHLLIIDNHGAWSDWGWPAGTQYYRAGARDWLGDLLPLGPLTSGAKALSHEGPAILENAAAYSFPQLVCE